MGSRIWFLVGMEVSMNQIVKVLMERDGYTKKEAETRLKEARMEKTDKQTLCDFIGRYARRYKRAT